MVLRGNILRMDKIRSPRHEAMVETIRFVGVPGFLRAGFLAPNQQTILEDRRPGGGLTLATRTIHQTQPRGPLSGRTTMLVSLSTKERSPGIISSNKQKTPLPAGYVSLH